MTRKWHCWEILNAGEGERGPLMIHILSGSMKAEDVAEYVAGEMDEKEKSRERLSDSDLDNGVTFVLVEHVPREGEWTCEGGRFRVRCRVAREYEAVRVKATPEGEQS